MNAVEIQSVACIALCALLLIGAPLGLCAAVLFAPMAVLGLLKVAHLAGIWRHK